MKGKQLFLLLVLAATAGGAWYFLAERNRGAWSETGGGGGKVIEFPINDVARVKIKNATGEVNLVKKANAWTVQERADYPASFEQVGGLLRKLWELKTVQEVKVGASQLPRLELEEPGKGAGTLVEFIGAEGKALAALLLGKKHVRKTEGGGEMGMGGGFPTGRYVKAAGGTKVSLVSDPLDDVEPKPERWLLKDFVKIDGPKSIAVTGATDAQKWTVTRENTTAEWKLADKPDEKADSGKTFALGTIFSSPTFDDVLAPDAKLEDTGFDKPTTAIIETFDGFRYELKIGKANGENFPVQVSVSGNFPKERAAGKDEKPEDKTRLDTEFLAKQKQLADKLAAEQKFAARAYLVPKFAVEPLLKDRAALLPDKPADTATPATPAPAPSAATPPVSAPTSPISVTTPPVSIPPAEATTPPMPIPPPPSASPAAPSAPAPAPATSAPAPTTPVPVPNSATPAPAPPAPVEPAPAPKQP